jgi:hypothetical protein
MMNDAVRPLRMCRGCSESLLSDDAAFCSRCGSAVVEAKDVTTGEAAKNFVTGVAIEARDYAKDALRNRDVKKIAGGAVLGAGAAMLIPFVSLGVGAVVGAGFVAFQRLTKD